MRSRLVSSLFLAAGVCLHAGCARHLSHGLVDRFMVHRESKSTGKLETPPSPSLEEAIAKLRRLMAEARPQKGNATPTLEMQDPTLKAAIAAVATSPSAANFVALGAAYHQRGLLDQAHENYMHALRLNARQADAYDGIARVWRDWRLPHLALGDAHRATYYAPDSAAAENTLGTVLQVLGRRSDAREAYRIASMLEPQAAYPLNNLCYLSFVEGNARQAIDECQAAVRLDPQLGAAHNNLALIYAAIGRVDLARTEFTQAGGAGVAAYNMGVVYLAQNQYASAADEFDRAGLADASMVDAAVRAREARRRATTASAGFAGQNR
jgi:Flp pilus assembly protein TadD